MSQSHSLSLPPASATARATAGGLAVVVYRSRAITPFSHDALQQLASFAQARNRRESVTGLMVYDECYFYQWLEGPVENVERLLTDITQDPRHSDIEILVRRAASHRTFSDWDMKLATREPQAGLWRHDVLYPRKSQVRALHQAPHSAPSVMAGMAPRGIAEHPTRSQDIPTSALLREFVKEAVLPELAARRGRPLPTPPRHIDFDRVIELADLLLSSDQAAAANLIHEDMSSQGGLSSIFTTLIEPAARRLGDLWAADACSEFDVTLGLCRLQAAVRLIGADFLPPVLGSAITPSVLVIPQPGELHALASALDSEVMWQAGWSPQCEYPTDDHGLEKLLHDQWFDVLDLSLSAALQREHWLPRLAETVRLARIASRNPALIIIAGGRIFADTNVSAGQVNANSANLTSADITRDIMRSLSPKQVVPIRPLLEHEQIFAPAPIALDWQT